MVEVEEDTPAVLTRLMEDKPIWLAMGLCFFFFTLLFLAGISIQWCFNRSRDDAVSGGAGAYSPPIGCYSKVGATIQFGMTRVGPFFVTAVVVLIQIWLKTYHNVGT